MFDAAKVRNSFDIRKPLLNFSTFLTLPYLSTP